MSASKGLGSLLLLSTIALAACGGDDDSGPGDEDGARFVFALPAEAGAPIPVAAIPFPNDVLIDAEGQLQITAETLPFDDPDPVVIGAVARAFQELDCFGLSGGVSFPVSGLLGDPLDPATFDGAVHIVDLADGSAIPAESYFREQDSILHVRPTREHRLREDGRYAFYVDATVATTAGASLAADDDLRALLADAAAEPRLATAWAAYAPLREHLAATGQPELVAATVMSTCEYSAQLEAMAADAVSRPAPALAVDTTYVGAAELDGFLGVPEDNGYPGIDNPGGIAHADLAAVVLGHFDAPYFLADTPGMLGRIEFDDAGAPIARSTDQIPYLLALPAGVDSYENLPVVVFQHGLNSSRRWTMTVANTLAAHGIATIGIDIPFHGDRNLEAEDKAHSFTDEQTPDGLSDGSSVAVNQFFDVLANEGVDRLDPLVMSDNFRQSAIDLVLLGHVIQSGDVAAVAAIDPAFADLSFDGEHIVYSSESFGGFVGVTAVAFAPGFQAAFFASAGGGLADQLLGNSAVYGALFIPVLGGAFSVPPNDLNALYAPPHTQYSFQILSMLLDRGDPLTYASKLRDKGVHVVLANAFSDEAVPNQASEALAMQIGLPWAPVEGAIEAPSYIDDYDTTTLPATGNLEGLTGAFFEMDAAGHAMITNSHDVRRVEPGGPPFVPVDPPLDLPNPVVRLQTLLARYAASYVETGTPTLEAGADVPAQ